jgi:hypothetical protein
MRNPPLRALISGASVAVQQWLSRLQRTPAQALDAVHLTPPLGR